MITRLTLTSLGTGSSPLRSSNFLFLQYLKANSYFARARILLLWKIPNQTDFDFACKKCAIILMPVYNAKSLALYTLVLSSRRFAAGSSSANRNYYYLYCIFHSPIDISSGSTKRQLEAAMLRAIALRVVQSIILRPLASRRRFPAV